MSGFQGMDVTQARLCCQDMRGGADQIGEMVRGVDALLDTIPWTGPDAARFLEQWRGTLRGRLARTVDDLHANASDLSRHADGQTRASR